MHRVDRDALRVHLREVASTRACPRSRENAKHIREALVRQATPQNSCPIVEINTTALQPAVSRAPGEDRERRAGAEPFSASEMLSGLCTAKVIARSTNQPISAE